MGCARAKTPQTQLPPFLPGAGMGDGGPGRGQASVCARRVDASSLPVSPGRGHMTRHRMRRHARPPSRGDAQWGQPHPTPSAACTPRRARRCRRSPFLSGLRGLGKERGPKPLQLPGHVLSGSRHPDALLSSPISRWGGALRGTPRPPGTARFPDSHLPCGWWKSLRSSVTSPGAFSAGALSPRLSGVVGLGPTVTCSSGRNSPAAQPTPLRGAAFHVHGCVFLGVEGLGGVSGVRHSLRGPISGGQIGGRPHRPFSWPPWLKPKPWSSESCAIFSAPCAWATYPEDRAGAWPRAARAQQPPASFRGSERDGAAHARPAHTAAAQIRSSPACFCA